MDLVLAGQAQMLFLFARGLFFLQFRSDACCFCLRFYVELLLSQLTLLFGPQGFYRFKLGSGLGGFLRRQTF